MFQIVEWQVRGPHLDSQKGRNLFSLEFLLNEEMRQITVFLMRPVLTVT